jgi:hypothetical protein
MAKPKTNKKEDKYKEENEEQEKKAKTRGDPVVQLY